jgi:sec-independent protein translocase protein TatA
MPGLPELLVILVIVMVVFGANKLPGIGDALGRSIRNFKRASGGDEPGADDDDEPAPAPARKKLPAKKPQIALEPASEVVEEDDEDDDEWEEVVVRRRKKKPAAG